MLAIYNDQHTWPLATHADTITHRRRLELRHVIKIAGRLDSLVVYHICSCVDMKPG